MSREGPHGFRASNGVLLAVAVRMDGARHALYTVGSDGDDLVMSQATRRAEGWRVTRGEHPPAHLARVLADAEAELEVAGGWDMLEVAL